MAAETPPPRYTLPEEVHPKAAALRALAVEGASPSVVPSRDPQATAYADDAAYLEQQLLRLRAVVEGAVARHLGDAPGQAAAQHTERQLRALIEQRVAATTAAGRAIGLESLRARMGLDDVDVDTLLHVLAPALDPGILKLHGRLTGVAWRSWVDVGFVVHVHFDGVAERLRARQRFLPGAPLLEHRLITLDRGRPEARENLLACEIKLPPRVARLLLGQDPSSGIAPYSSLIDPEVSLDQVVLPDEARAEIRSLLDAQPHLAKRLASWGFDRVLTNRGVVVLLVGPPGTGKSTLARALARQLGKRLILVDGIKLLEAARTMEEQIDELFQEARLQDAVIFFDECEALFASRSSGNRTLGTLLRALDRFNGLAVLATNLAEKLDPALDRRVLLRVALDVPAPSLREKIWALHLPKEVPLAPGIDISVLAKRYDFSGGYIKNAVLLAVSRALARGERERVGADGRTSDEPATGGRVLTMEDLEQASQAQLRGDLTSYAERTRSTLTLESLILPPDVKSQIVEIIAAGKNRSQVLFGWGFNETIPTGKGQVVLLSGDPGTGKTLSAEIIAAELGMSLYRINPAKVISKYVGETEKNLNEILGQAKSMHAILFFDEADGLFSARVSKVESANDRFVNMETNFLLQQLERFEGLVILATNLETMIDQAFKRRIHYHVVVPFPDPPSRERIWRRVIPTRAPVATDVNYALLGKTFELSGGHIKNAAMRAAYMAAQSGGQITQAILDDAAEKECVAAGKLFQHVDARPTSPSPARTTSTS